MSTVVSVVIPYYHGDRFVPRLLHMMEENADLLIKNGENELEVLFVNDSPEETVIVKGDHSFQIKILTNPKNQGIHAARVHGLKKAKGEYILFLDQDDMITGNCLESQLRHIGEADLVIGNGYDTEPGGKKHLIFRDRAHQIAATHISCHYYYNNLIRSPGQVLIRKSSIPQYWADHILKNNGSDDALLWILMLSQNCKTEINEESLYIHTFTGENASGDDSAMLHSQMEVAELVKGIASPLGMHEFRRRAKYYCQGKDNKKLGYLDVGLSRALYSKLFFRN